MKSGSIISIVVVALLLVAGAWTIHRQSARDEGVREYLIEGRRLETDGEFGRAIQVYEQALDPDTALALTSGERADLRYRLAHAMIQTWDLQRALGRIEELIEQDVAAHRIDVTPLLMDLGDRAIERGDRALAKLAYRLGQSVSVTTSRVTDFAEKQEQFIRQPESAATGAGESDDD